MLGDEFSWHCKVHREKLHKSFEPERVHLLLSAANCRRESIAQRLPLMTRPAVTMVPAAKLHSGNAGWFAR